MKSKYFVFVLQIGLGIKILSFSFAAFALSPTIACYEAAIHDREVLKVNKQYYENFGESGLRTIEQALVVLCAGTKSPSATINCYKEAIAKPSILKSNKNNYLKNDIIKGQRFIEVLALQLCGTGALPMSL